MDRFQQVLHYPLVKLSDGALTLGRIFVALAVVGVSWVLAAFAARGFNRLLERRGVESGTLFAIRKIVRYTVVLIGILIAIGSTGFNLSAVFAASAVLLVGVGFGLQNIAQNFISGLIVLFEQPVRKGDFIKAADTYGVVDDIGLRATRVITRDHVTVIVPNSQLITNAVINHSTPTTQLRVRIRVCVAYNSDTVKVAQILAEVARSNQRVLSDPPPEVRFDNFAESSLEFSLLVWISNARDDLRVGSELRFAIAAAFRSAKIEMPFPQRDIHLRSGLEELAKVADKFDPFVAHNR